MNDANSKFEALREILHRPPGARAWDALCAHLTTWPESDEKDLALTYAMSHLEAWDDRLRQGPIELWWPTFPKGKPRPEWCLVRALRLDEPHVYMRPKTSERPAPEATEQIRSFQLAPHRASMEDYLAFIDGFGLTSLRALHMENHQLGPDALKALFAAPWIDGLTRLDLAYNALGDDGLTQLIKAFDDGELTWLNIAANALTDRAIDALCSSPLFANLMHVDLGFNELSPAVLGRFVEALSPGQLQSLRLDGLAFDTDQGAGVLLLHPSLSGLTTLSMARCQLGDKGAQILAAASGLHQLERLDLAHNQISQRGAEALAKTRYLQHLQALNLSYNPIGVLGLQAITRSPQLQRITQLHIRGVKL